MKLVDSGANNISSTSAFWSISFVKYRNYQNVIHMKWRNDTILVQALDNQLGSRIDHVAKGVRDRFWIGRDTAADNYIYIDTRVKVGQRLSTVSGDIPCGSSKRSQMKRKEIGTVLNWNEMSCPVSIWWTRLFGEKKEWQLVVPSDDGVGSEGRVPDTASWCPSSGCCEFRSDVRCRSPSCDTFNVTKRLNKMVCV